ncbi:MAG: hypothetical protein AB9873_07015 [Syntrophobacteraceae bacterium]
MDKENVDGLRLAALAQRERELDLALTRLKSGESRKTVIENKLDVAKERIRELEEQLGRLRSQEQSWQR